MYKKVPCRHFDQKSGRPISLGCSKGDNCRFVHPHDANWRNTTGGYRRTPLVSQSSAILRHARERSLSPGRDRASRQSVRYGRGREVVRRDCSQISSTPGNGAYSEQGNNTTCKRGEQQRKEINPEAPQVSKGLNLTEDNTVKHQQLIQGLRSDQISSSFARIARLSRESDILGELQKKEENKIATYTTIGETLDRLSSQIETTVNPRISQSTRIRDDCKKTIEENNEAIKKVWGEAINVFVEEVTQAVDAHVQVALQNMRNEAESITNEIIIGARKHCLNSIDVGPAAGPQQKEVERAKRRRTRAPSPLSPNGSSSREGSLAQFDTIREMKIKIEQQAQALTSLTKENEELRAGIQGK